MASQLVESLPLVALGSLLGFLFTSLLLKRPVFTKGFIKQKLNGKYDRWANGLTIKQFSTLLWVVGEYSCRAGIVFAVLDGRLELTKAQNLYPFQRARLALETIAKLANGERTDFLQFVEAIRKLESTH